MALGNDEAATLEIEVDVTAFEAGMAKVEKTAERTTNKINKQYEFMGNAAQKSFAKQAKDAEVAWAKIGLAVGAGVAALTKYWRVMERGTGEGAQSLRNLEAAWDRLGDKVGEQQASVWKPIADLLEKVNEKAAESPGVIAAMGHGFASAINPALGLAAALAAINGQLTDRITLATNIGPSSGARLGAQGSNTTMVGADPRDLAGGFLAGTGHDRAAGGGGGGGGGGGRMPGESGPAETGTDLAESLGAINRDRTGDVEAYLERWQSADSVFGDIQDSMNSKLFDASGQRRQIVQDEAKEWFAMEEAKQRAIEGTTQALIQSTIATIAHGAAEGMSAKQIANRVAVAAAWHALEEAAAGVAALAVTWGVPNPAATGHFVAAGMYGALAVGAAGVGAALPGGRGRGGGGGGGGGGFASPRGGPMGGGQSGPVNVNVKISAIDLGDRGTLKRVGDVVSAATAAGFVRGRQRG